MTKSASHGRSVPCCAPLVSVVIPVRDGERYIDECIRGVLAQTAPILEVLVIDDGSTDGTRDAVARFGDPVRCLSTPPRGVSAARNVGLREARGNVIAWLDADDVWLPTKLDHQLRALGPVDRPAGACCGYAVTEAGLHPRKVVVPGSGDGALAVRRALLVEGPGIGFSFTGLVTRAAAEAVGLFDERLSTSADLDYAWRIARDWPLVAVPEVLALHRHHGPVQMHRDTGILRSDMAVVLDAAEQAGLPPAVARRGRANLARYLAVRAWREGRDEGSLGAIARTALPCPAGSGRMLAEGVLRRPAQRRQARRLVREFHRTPPVPSTARTAAREGVGLA